MNDHVTNKKFRTSVNINLRIGFSSAIKVSITMCKVQVHATAPRMHYHNTHHTDSMAS